MAAGLPSPAVPLPVVGGLHRVCKSLHRRRRRGSRLPPAATTTDVKLTIHLGHSMGADHGLIITDQIREIHSSFSARDLR